MATITAELEPQGLGLVDYLAIGKRRARMLLLAAGAGLLTTLLLAFLLPPVYQSIGTILIEQQEMPPELVRSTVTSYADQRVQVISQRVMTTQNLLDIIRRYNLYSRERNRESREALIARMRNDINVKMISADVIDPRSGRPTSATIAFSVAYSNHSPDRAFKVANELSTLFLNENLSTRTKQAQDAASFLEGEADRVNKHMEELEARVAAFRAQHFDSLPELEQFNMQLLDRTSQDLDKDETHRASLEQQQVYLEAQLAQLKPNSAIFSESGERILSTHDRLKSLRSQLASARALYAPDHPDIARLQREIAGLEAEDQGAIDVNDIRRDLEQARGELAAAQDRYGPEHPDRIHLQKQVASLEEDLATATAAQNKGNASAATASKGGPKDADNPAYIQIEAQLSATRNELQALADEEARLRAQRAAYEKKITLEPQTERDYRDLMRDYENTKVKYQELRSKQQEATVSKNLETDRKGERFTLIEPPLPPEEPVSPNRPLVLLLGLVLSVVLAIGAAAAAESLDATVRGRRDLMRIVAGAPPLAIIPRIGAIDIEQSPWRARAVAAATIVGVLLTAATAVHFLYRPLDVLWFVLMRRLGF
ncbi:MAG TPA: GNVR domain-containing protein [Steroidobacteraceae bacterium]|nr:GNVR domain-containing protein [Steroidobacteraceae bacterium]